MLKNILNLEGAQQLSKNEQKTIKGGITRECSDAIQGGECYWKPVTGCTLGYAVNTGTCSSAAICCESL